MSFALTADTRHLKPDTPCMIGCRLLCRKSMGISHSLDHDGWDPRRVPPHRRRRSQASSGRMDCPPPPYEGAKMTSVEAVRAVIEALDRCGIRYMLVGLFSSILEEIRGSIPPISSGQSQRNSLLGNGSRMDCGDHRFLLPSPTNSAFRKSGVGSVGSTAMCHDTSSNPTPISA